jgi:cytochrome oxidase Cu insertion factor (SCO1/SenC/PrrC family)
MASLPKLALFLLGLAMRLAVPDLEVLDQDGRTLHAYTDLIQGKTVVVSFMYTSCTAVCPLMGKTLAKLQDALGPRLGSDVFFLSISMDPENDTPERLKAWGERFARKPGWTLVTGTKENVEELQTALAGAPVRKGDHTPAVLLLNLDRGIRIREFGLAAPDRYLQLLEPASPAAASAASAGPAPRE